MWTRPGVVCAVVVLAGRLLTAADDEGFRPLFNGRDLTGWVLVNTPPQTWTVADEMLVCSGKPIGEIRTDRMYQNFVLELEWRHMVPGGNAGVFIWADDITARGVPFHRGIEVQVLDTAYGESSHHTTHGDIFPIHGAEMIPDNGRGGSRAFPTENRSRPSPEWNHYRVTCLDGTIRLEVNGRQVTSGRECNPRKGYICLESEGGVVHYRNLKIRELPGDEPDASLVASANRDFRSLYTGLDLSGWETTDSDVWQSHDWILQMQTDSPEKPARLTTTEEFHECGVVLDFRLADGASRIQIGFGGLTPENQGLQFPRDSSEEVRMQTAVGQWHRLELRRVAEGLEATLDGHPLEADGIQERSKTGQPVRPGGLTIGGSGKVEFANIYVRIAAP